MTPSFHHTPSVRMSQSQTASLVALATMRNRSSLARTAAAAPTRSTCAHDRSTTSSMRATSAGVQSRGAAWWAAIIATSRPSFTSGQHTMALMPMALNVAPPSAGESSASTSRTTSVRPARMSAAARGPNASSEYVPAVLAAPAVVQSWRMVNRSLSGSRSA
ncbi:hypothetical protein J0H58_21235 [bacterium]|nr:hypothetical protein [bacterium]